MQRKERNQLWRIPLIVSAITGIIYLIIYLSTGSIPVVDKLILFEKPTDAFWSLPAEYTLPFSISQAWDIVFIAVFAFLLVRIFQYVRRDKDILNGLTVGFGFGLGFSLATGLVIGLVDVLAVGLGAGLVIGLVAGLESGLRSGLVAGLTGGLGFGLGFSLTVGLATGLVGGLVVGLATGLAAGLGFSLAAGLGFSLAASFKYLFPRCSGK